MVCRGSEGGEARHPARAMPLLLLPATSGEVLHPLRPPPLTNKGGGVRSDTVLTCGVSVDVKERGGEVT